MVRPGIPGARIELPRPGRVVAGRSIRCAESVLSIVPAMVAFSHGRAVDDSHRDRLASGDFRHLFDDQAGDATRLFAAYERGVYIGDGYRPDTRSGHQLHLACRGRG